MTMLFQLLSPGRFCKRHKEFINSDSNFTSKLVTPKLNHCQCFFPKIAVVIFISWSSLSHPPHLILPTKNMVVTTKIIKSEWWWWKWRPPHLESRVSTFRAVLAQLHREKQFPAFQVTFIVSMIMLVAFMIFKIFSTLWWFPSHQLKNGLKRQNLAFFLWGVAEI